MFPSAASRTDPTQRAVVAAAGGLLLAGAALLAAFESLRMAGLLVLGAALGLTLYHAAFGFTGTWRAFIADRRSDGLRAQMAMLAIAVALFYPVLASGELWGRSVGGFVAPLSTAVLVGAFIFGLGMQLGGGCGSGTLMTVGAGSPRMVLTLGGFLAGSVLATAHLAWWRGLPGLRPVSVVRELGPWAAIALMWAAFAAVAFAAWLGERRRHGAARPIAGTRDWRRVDWRHGPWPLLAGAVLLAVLNFAVLGLAGHPWAVTSGFLVWGGQIADALGLPIADWPFWQSNRWMLEISVFSHAISVTDFGLLIGAFLGAGLAGRYRPSLRLPGRSAAAALIGGLMLGYGARLAYGCNIGAYFSGIASGSLHGWLWLAAAFAGNWLGVAARPLFGLAVERTAAALPKPA